MKALIFVWAIMSIVGAGPQACTYDAPLAQGRVVFYGPSWEDCSDGQCWETIAENQGVTIPSDYVPIAHWDKAFLGNTGTLTVNERVYRVIAVDCTAAQDIQRVHYDLNIVAEVPYWLAEEAGFAFDGWAMGALEWDAIPNIY